MLAKTKPSKTIKTNDYIKQKGGSEDPLLLKKYAYRITNNIKNAIKGNVNDDPVAKQYIPQDKELITTPDEDTDPIGDEAHSPIKGIVHRYPDRVLFKPVNVCAVYCRYCFRRETVGPGSEILSATEIKTALDYIRNHKEIWEVILTGGDPLVLSPRQLRNIIDELNQIEHVQIIRIHTRVPIADPNRINDNIINVLQYSDTVKINQKISHTKACKNIQSHPSPKPIYIVLHINHANELTTEVRYAITALLRANCVLLSQSVLLKGVNDNPEALESLFRELIKLRIKPYYLHHPDLAPGTSHFRLTIKEGQNIVKSLQGRVSGICLPTYMLDIPGGYGKIPLTPCFIKQLENDTYTAQNYKGESLQYPPNKDEKNQ